MELQAAIEALRALKELCDAEFRTNSSYVRTRWREKLPTRQEWGKSYPQDRYKNYPQDQCKSYPLIIYQASCVIWLVGGIDPLADGQ